MTPERVPATAPLVEARPAQVSRHDVRRDTTIRNAMHSVLAPANDPAEVEAANAAEAATQGRLVPRSRARAHARKIYRQVAQSPDAPAGLIVEDEAAPPDPSRMRKSEFVDAVQEAMCREVEDSFAGSQYEGRGCPFVTEAMDFYRRLPAESVEASIRRYAPEASNVRTARGYVPVMTRRVRASVDTFVRTGRIEGIPPEMQPLAAMAMVRGSGGFGGLLMGALGGALAGIGGALLGVGWAIGGAFRALFKHRSDPVGPSVDAHSVRSGLGAGARLDAGVRGRMERAFGHDFSSVRIHADDRAGSVAEGLGARALTVGNDVAFAPGEYRPGTPVGDAIIAHELAHTVQQKSATAAGAPAHGLEDDADAAAANAVGSLWGGLRERAARPRRRTGLSLQRCASTPAKQTTTTPATKPTAKPGAKAEPDKVEIYATLTDAEWIKQAGEALDFWEENKAKFKELGDKMLPLFRSALREFEAGVTVRLAGDTVPKEESPADYSPFPAVNFDPRLSDKLAYWSDDKKKKFEEEQKLPLDKQTIKERKHLADNAGHSFSAGAKKYLVLGPKALDREGKSRVQRWYRHEVSIIESFGKQDPEPIVLTPPEAYDEKGALKAVPESKDGVKVKPEDTELTIWTTDFVNFFSAFGWIDKTYGYMGDTWAGILRYYDGSSPSARTASIEQLKAYYQNPPSKKQQPDEKKKDQDDTRALLHAWLKKRFATSQVGLVPRLAKELGLTLKEEKKP